MLQTSTPAELRGRVMALAIAMSTAAVPVGMALGGVMGDVWRGSLREVVAACGAALMALMLLHVSPFRPRSLYAVGPADTHERTPRGEENP
jgi:predicted MFS family arabinose efflux permease